MLTFLSIRNLALVDQLLWEPQDGFICITGETGAGKSVLISAIGLALGERADKTLIRSGEQTCTVEAVFNLPAQSDIHQMLDSHGVPPCEEGTLMIRRSISASVNRQFINDSPCTLSLLREIGAHLVDLHGPNDHRSLVSRERQLSLLDSFGEHQQLLNEYTGAWQIWHDVRKSYNELLQSEAATEREIDLLRHQIDEIAAADFTVEEVATLEERWQRSRNGARLIESAGRMLSILQGDAESSLSARLHELIRCAHDLGRLDPSADAWLTPLAGMEVELGEVEHSLEGYIRDVDSDPAELAELEQRINSLESLKRKYGPGIEDILLRYEEALKRLDRIENRSERLDELETTMNSLKKHVEQTGMRLGKARKKAAPLLAAEIVAHSRELGFLQSSFDVVVAHLEEPTPTGYEEIEFLFGPNPGEPSKPLRLIASSGELSRIMLAIKSALADKDSTPLLVFDEIDSNVGGEIARSVGKKMLELGTKHQVISITHFPQVASLASHHYLVEKGLVRDRSISRLREVAGDERIDELVRMLGGGGDEARAHARTLLL